MAKTKAPAAREGAVDPGLPQKKRARRRLVGAAAVSLALAITLPLLLDSEPKRVPEDIQVQIPSRDTPVSAPAPARTASSTDAQRVPEAQSTGKAGDDATVARADGKAAAPGRNEAKQDPRAEARPDPKSDAKGAGRPDPKTDAKAVPKSDAKSEPGRYALQVGAFSTEKGANDQVEKLRQAGLRAYVERIKTGQGDRSRVRVGPFASRDAADKARAELKLLGIDSAVIAP